LEGWLQNQNITPQRAFGGQQLALLAIDLNRVFSKAVS
jgi:hypothetical protein